MMLFVVRDARSGEYIGEVGLNVTPYKAYEIMDHYNRFGIIDREQDGHDIGYPGKIRKLNMYLMAHAPVEDHEGFLDTSRITLECNPYNMNINQIHYDQGVRMNMSEQSSII